MVYYLRNIELSIESEFVGFIMLILFFIFPAFVHAHIFRGAERHDNNVLEDAALDVPTIIRKYGYPCEVHSVTTEDGYILELHRIHHDTGQNRSMPERPVVFLMHGLLSSSAEWVLMGPHKGLGYILADSGYDVWMGNARGNVYSRNHNITSPNDSSFWKFSWHEIGFFDLPASIDYVLAQSKAERLHYIGFSQGTTAFWVMASSRTDYNDKIISMHALAPIAYVSHIRSPLIRAIAPFTQSIQAVTSLLGVDEFLPNGRINELAGQRLCLDEALLQPLCTNILFLICGFNANQLNSTMLPAVMGHTPAGASTKQLVHFGQLYQSGYFRQYDFGWIRNVFAYGSFSPPSYNLTAITTPVYLHYSSNDWLATEKDVDILLDEIPSVIGKFKVSHEEFNHMDFIFAIDVKYLIYDRLLNIMGNYK